MASRALVSLSCAASLCLCAPVPLSAQCPDGSPPPCRAGARRASRPVPPEAERRRLLVVLPFRNLSRSADDEWIVEGSTTMLGEALGRWRELAVVEDQRLYPVLRRLGVAPGTLLDPAQARRVAEDTDSWTVVTGEVIRSGGLVRLSARAEDAATRRVLVPRAAAEVAPTADIREAFERLAVELAAGVAGLQAAVPRAPATPGTRSLEAYRAYLRGAAHANHLRVQQAREAFLEAISLDSGYAEAWLGVVETQSRSFADLFNPGSLLYRAAEQAVRLAPSLPERRQRLIRGVHAFTRSQFAAARRELGALVAADSSDLEALEWLAGVELFDWVLVSDALGTRVRGSPQTGARLANRAADLDPGRGRAHEIRAYIYGLAAGMWTGGIVWGTRREAASLAAFLGGASEGTYRMVLRRDSLRYIADDDKGVDSVTDRERRDAITEFREATARWARATPGSGEAHLLSARAHELAGRLDSALLELRVSESLGVETRLDNPAARRMVVLGRLGRFEEARRVADSLQDAGHFSGGLVPILRTPFFADPGAWAAHLFMLGLDTARLVRLFLAFDPSSIWYAACRGTTSRGFPRTVTDSIRLTVARRYLSPQTRVVTPRVLECLNEVFVALRSAPLPPRLAREALAAAGAALAAGDTVLGVWRIEWALRLDTTTVALARDSLPWLRALREADEAVRRETEGRMEPLGAEVRGDELTLLWRVSGREPLRWNRRTSRPFASEHFWEARLRTGPRTWLVGLRGQRNSYSSPESGPLDSLVLGRTPSVLARDSSDRFREFPEARSRVEVAGDTLRVAVRHSDLASRLRSERPTTLEMTFFPCVQRRQADGSCAASERPISYR